MRLTINLNEPRIMEKVQNDRFGLLVSQNWKRLIDPYTPRDTQTMQNNVRFYPFKIHYFTEGYPEKVYYGYDLKFQKKNPYSTYEWDKGAEQAGQKDKLYQTINIALRNGRI